MSRRWKIVTAVVILIGVALLYPLAVHNHAKSALAEYRKQLQAYGEKLTIAEVAPHVTAAQITAAQDVMGAIRSLSYSYTDYPPAMHYIAPGKAMAAWAEDTLPTSDSTNVWPRALLQVSRQREELSNSWAVLENSDARFDLDYSQGFLLLLPHLAQIKRAAMTLNLATLAELREDYPSNALEDLKSCVALTRPMEHEPIEISQLVRIAIGQIAANATWELLQYPGWQDAQLAGLQTEWGSFNFLDGVGPSLEMERAILPMTYDVGRGSYSNVYAFTTMGAMGASPPTMDDLGQFLANPKDGYEAFMNRYPRYWAWKHHWSYVEELYNLQCNEAGLDCARSIQNGGASAPASKKLGENLAAINNLNTNDGAHFVLGMGGDMISRYLLKIADIEMERQIVVTAIALKRYQVKSGKFPTDLNALVPEYLHELPIDLMDGKPLRYQPRADGTFLLYSVGEDGEDNGGDPTATQSTGTFSQYPLWWRGRDAVWPMLAAPEEIKAYKDKLIADWHSKQVQKKPVPNRATAPPPITNTN